MNYMVNLLRFVNITVLH